MNPSVLAGNIRDLEKSLDSLQFWLKLATGSVVLGLLLEYPHEIRDAVFDFRKSRTWKPLFVIAGAILITAGVAGELFIQSRESVVEGDLREANDKVQAGLEKEASQARVKAEQATAASQGAEARIAEARQASAEADERAAKARSIAESERLERVKLQAIVAPRSLSNCKSLVTLRRNIQ